MAERRASERYKRPGCFLTAVLLSGGLLGALGWLLA